MKTLNTRNRIAYYLTFSIICLSLLLQSCENDDFAETPVSPPTDPGLTFDYSTPTATDQNGDQVVPTVNLSEITIGRNYSNSELRLNVYEAQDNVDDERPVVILSPGGGFQSYNQIEKIESMAKDFAKRGYVAAVLRYTVNSAGPTPEVWLKANLDQKLAIRYIKANAVDLKIDAENIFTGGWSSGGQISLNASHLSYQEYLAIEQPLLQAILNPEIEKFGFEPTGYDDFNDDVKGTIIYMPYAWDTDIFEEDGPAVMLASHVDQSFADGTLIWGADVASQGILNQGPDLMKDALLNKGYVLGQNFQYEVVDGNHQDLHHNESILYLVDFDIVVDFIHRNLD